MKKLKDDSSKTEIGDSSSEMEKRISFGNFIAHLIPGVVAMIAISRLIPPIPESIENNQFILGVVFVSLALASGLFLDCVRYIAMRLIALIPKVAALDKFKRVPSNSEIDLYNWIIDNSWRHHQFAGNLCLAVCLALPKPPGDIGRVWIVSAALALAVAAILLYKTTIDQLNQAFPKRV